LMKTIGIDRDEISLEEAKSLKTRIESEQNCQVILYQTKRGFHFILIYDSELTKKENFEIREKYDDCTERLKLSKLRDRIPDVPTDILFSMKNNHWRRRVW